MLIGGKCGCPVSPVNNLELKCSCDEDVEMPSDLANQHVYTYWCDLMSNSINDAYDYLFYRQQIDKELVCMGEQVRIDDILPGDEIEVLSSIGWEYFNWGMFDEYDEAYEALSSFRAIRTLETKK